MKLSDFWNDKFPPLNLYNCPDTHRYEQLVLGRTFKTVTQPVENIMEDKILVPISQRIASKIVGEHPNLTGVITASTTVFYDNNEPVLEMTKYHNEELGGEVVSYSAYMSKYKQGE